MLIIGGFTSVPGAIVGGLIVGAGEKLAEVLSPGADPHLRSRGGGIEYWFAYVLALVVPAGPAAGPVRRAHHRAGVSAVLYREAGQFKTTYAADQAIFPIAQDRWFVIGCCSRSRSSACRCFAGQYLYTAVLIPFLILSLAAIGLNILIGYCGQISLGTGAFMAIGAYAAYNLALRLPETNIDPGRSCSAA